MKARNLLIAAAAVVLILPGLLALRWPGLHSTFTGGVGVRFAGFSNGQPSTFTSALPAHYDAFLREWLASGTNVALFTVTNGRGRSLLLHPYVGFFERTNAVRSHYETVLPCSGSGYGLRLRPGEAATVQVAILPRKGSGFLRFGYSPDYRDVSSRLVEELRTLITTRRRPVFQSEWIYSEQIIP